MIVCCGEVSMDLISAFQAFILGIVEGITEYLPISSTGHLTLTSQLLGLRNEALTPDQLAAIEAYEIIIQSGAILAVVILYKDAVMKMVNGLLGRSVEGRKLFINICFAAFPALIVGYLIHKFIERYLHFPGPVLFALAAGGILMIFWERFMKRHENASGHDLLLHELSPKKALAIGCLQCLALWPGTSRSMVTILGGMLVGLRRPIAAEFSFLVGLPVLLAATAYKGLKDGPILIEHVGWASIVVGLVTSTVFAIIAVKWLVSFLNRHGLAPFGWYRLILSVVYFFIIGI